MRFLVGLGLLQAVLGVGEVGAAILTVIVEEELVQLVLEVIMVGDVALRTRGAVAPEQPFPAKLALLDGLAVVAALFPAVVAGDELQKVEDRPVLDDQPAVHISLADRQARVAHQLERDLAIGNADRQILAAAGPISVPLAVGHDDRNPPPAQQRSD